MSIDRFIVFLGLLIQILGKIAAKILINLSKRYSSDGLQLFLNLERVKNNKLFRIELALPVAHRLYFE